jgi:hypothetical protein
VVAVVLFIEALGIAALNWFLGVVADRQDMSLASLDPDVMSTSLKTGGCALRRLLRAVCPGRPACGPTRPRPAGIGRALLISAAVVHALLLMTHDRPGRA